MRAYRRDIDGLRAVAVLPVILSHAGLRLFSGGFVGVDVFFVISGYLIAGILLGEMEAGTYSLRRFYERRARRILPALLLVLLVSFPFAWWLMLPDFLQNFGQSVVATLLFSNNLLLAMTSGYWDLESGFKPLLHTWSLGVEEQFYIVFPLMLAGVWRWGRRWQLVAIALVGMASLAAAEHGWRANPGASFYLPTTRAWELMIGCAMAYVKRRDGKWDGVLSGLGLVTILACVVLYDERIPSPSLYVLPPVAGAAAIVLFNRPGVLAYRLLSTPVAVGIGLISYSAYLWHQPLIALARVASLAPPPAWIMCLLAFVSLGLAWLSWRFVEVPFRSRERVPWPAFAWSIGCTSALLLAAGLFLHVQQGVPKRIFPGLETPEDIQVSYNERIREYSAAEFPPTGGKKVLVIGNSVARDAANILVEAGAIEGNSMVYLAAEPATIASGEAPQEYGSLIREADVIVFAAHDSDDGQRYAAAVRRISAGSAAKILVFGPKYFGWNLNPYGRVPVNARAHIRSRVPDFVVDLNAVLHGRLDGVQYVDVLKLLGEDGTHVAVFDGQGNPLSPDRIHLTKYGARELAQRLAVSRPELLEQFHAE